MQQYIQKIQTKDNKGANSNAVQLQDNRPQTLVQKKQVEALTGRSFSEAPVQKKVNTTGLPDNLKSGIENLSGHSMDDVKVHYNSAQPAQLNAHAYAQGTDIHVASGQEKHLPHEAWHVVQQKQGRVKPTTQLKAKVNINDDTALEKEADVMGAKALNPTRPAQLVLKAGAQHAGSIIQGMFNLDGVDYTENKQYGIDSADNNILMVKKGAAPPVPQEHFIQVGSIEKDLSPPSAEEQGWENEGGASVPLVEFDTYTSNKQLNDKMAQDNPNDCAMYANALRKNEPTWKKAGPGNQFVAPPKADYHPMGYKGADQDASISADIGEMYVMKWDKAEDIPSAGDPEGGKDVHHAATVVARDGADQVTCEANAGKDLGVPEFQMYGPLEKSFYEIHKDYFTRQDGTLPYMAIAKKHGAQ